MHTVLTEEQRVQSFQLNKYNDMERDENTERSVELKKKNEYTAPRMVNGSRKLLDVLRSYVLKIGTHMERRTRERVF